MTSRGPTFVSTFSGAGGMDLGFAQAGFGCLWACDLSADAAATHRLNLGGMSHAGDIDDLVETIPTQGVDLVIGGPPCQGFSRGGHMSRGDERSRHVWTFLSVVERVQPSVFVMENVASLATNPRFAEVVPALKDEARSLGYDAEVWVLDAADYGVPQRRERMFLVGSRVGPIARPLSLTAQVTLREALSSLPRYGDPGNDTICNARVVLAANPVLRTSPFAGMLFNGGGRVLDLDAPSLTLPASMGGNRTPIIDQDWVDGFVEEPWVVGYHRRLCAGGDPEQVVPASLRRMTVEEAQVVQSFPAPDVWQFCGAQNSRYRQIGNAVPPRLARAIAESVQGALSDSASLEAAA